jgi:hypothetical protein
MPSIMDKMSHATAVAKWKADQQVRILRAQNSLRDLENQARVQKASLGEATFSLYASNGLTEGELINLCQQISQIYSQIQSTHQNIEAIKQEQAPVDTSLYSSAFPPVASPTMRQGLDPASPPLSGLVCPECGMALVGRFCPVHGKEGILPNL